MTEQTTLNGCWILDKSKEPWSMNQYLEVMNVDPLAIAAHEKGEKEHDTFHTIEMVNSQLKITKRSRVNNDLVQELVLNQEKVDYLPPGNRPKRVIARSDHPGHLTIQSSLETSNGVASVTDTKTLTTIDDQIYLLQELVIVNEATQKTHKTIRHFKPYDKTPPHLEETPPVASKD